MAYPFNAGTRHPCEIEDCDADFARLADKQRHVREHHGDLLHCPEPGCSWPGAKRRSRLDLHRQKEHGNIQKVALIVPVGFGSTSPEQSSYILAQAAQPESSSTGQNIIPISNGRLKAFSDQVWGQQQPRMVLSMTHRAILVPLAAQPTLFSL
ncbi:hypothetical protein L207DRAFT_346078 [Hyaloscypha variabilis F]|uniref:C2H2-type domain-containing protein n=1 Tax=Hyaloscypha variabilis (strain UAMH 11265 / GT02V1 / F) TaxID=1149755 RepID=A0A2J6RQM6_HYAVF|nr:hypothetical protein L207DRAFT_346078 [Hyaloscypha variabilis F]